MSAQLLTIVALIVFASGFVAGSKVENWRDAAVEKSADEKRELDRLIRQTSNNQIKQILIEKDRKDRKSYEELLRRLPVLVPPGSCELPSGWRLLHDSAATGEDPSSRSGDNGGTVPAQDAAATVAENYQSHRRIADQLEACQRYIRDVVKPEGMQ